MTSETMPDHPSWDELKPWRDARRKELIARRMNAAEEVRRGWNERMTELLVTGFPFPPDTVIGFCWPYQAEFDARFAVRHWREHGCVAALPEVVAKGTPLRFGKWWPGAPLRKAVFGIPVPDGTEIVTPHAAIVPMNGFDEGGFRLGYGGGYFDRTLAARQHRLIAIGVSFEILRLPTIYPQPHDIPMDFVVTEAGIHAVRAGRLASITPVESSVLLHQLLGAKAGAQYASPACYANEFKGYFGGASDDGC